MTYRVHEIFYSLQGEGARTGTPAVFCRFTGCDLWSGREEDRAGAICRFCDTDFAGTDGAGGGVFRSAGDLADTLLRAWPRVTAGEGVEPPPPSIVLTGGEPLLQVDPTLLAALHDRGFFVAVETNGAHEPPQGIDYLTVSPKTGAPFVARAGDELKLLFPQPGLDPADFEGLPFRHFFLQPLDEPPHTAENTRAALDYCLRRPRWRLSIQLHKLLGIP